MLDTRPRIDPGKIGVVVLTADADFEQSARSALGASGKIEVTIVRGTLGAEAARLDIGSASVLIVDLNANDDEEMAELQRLLLKIGRWPPVVVVTQEFSADVARRLVQMRVSDFLVKPVTPVELVRACARVSDNAGGDAKEAQIYTFLPSAGGVGVTSLAIQTAMILLNSGPKGSVTTCLVDLDFQHGACADYLDIEPRLDLSEIEPRPERLDRQLLEVMLSRHGSGLSVIAAPNRPAEMRSFDPNVVTRLLDLVSSHFDYVVIDMPRTWFSWTDSVLLGSNHLYIVSEMTVPGLRHAKQLVAAICERLGQGPKPQVIVNRFEQRMFAPGLRRTDIKQALGPSFAGTIPNNYGLVREAIDRGVTLDEVKSGNNVSAELKKLILQRAGAQPDAADEPAQKKLMFWAR